MSGRFQSKASDWQRVPTYFIDPASPPVRAWSAFRLPFEPKGHQLTFKTLLAAKVKALAPGTDEIVECVYQSSNNAFVDTENVLIYNLGASCFSKAAARGVRFERVCQEPPPCPETLPAPGAVHYMEYRVVASSTEFRHWRRAKTVAAWTDADWPAHGGSAPTPFWLALRKAQVRRLGVLHSGPFGLRVTVTGAGSPLRPATLIKPLFDAAISAFHVHDDPESMGKAIDQLAKRGKGSAASLKQLLTDPTFDLLGSRNLLSAYRSGANSEGVKWNPEDERCVAGELLWSPTSGPKRFSGELFEVLPRSS